MRLVRSCWPVILGAAVGCGDAASVNDDGAVVSLPLESRESAADRPGVVPTPVTLAEALAIADLSPFAPPGDATRAEAKPFSFSYSAPVTAQRTVATSLVDLDQRLVAAGWTRSADPPPQVFPTGAISFYQKQGIWLIASLGESRGFSPTNPGQEAGADLNVTAMVLGNVDPRALPLPPTAQMQTQDPSSVGFTTPRDLLDVRKFYRTELVRLGWRECVWQPLAGVEIPMETKERSQWFFRNGVKLDIHLERTDGGTRVFVRPVLMQVELPLPDDADDIELGDAPTILFYATRQPLSEAVAFVRREMAARGWSAAESPPIPEKRIAAAFDLTAEGRNPLRCEFLETERSVLMQLQPAR